MKNFIKSQENIIKEICNEDINYKETSLSFIEKTLKAVTNETDKSAFDLIDQYITDNELLNKIIHDNKLGITNSEQEIQTPGIKR